MSGKEGEEEKWGVLITDDNEEKSWHLFDGQREFTTRERAERTRKVLMDESFEEATFEALPYEPLAPPKRRCHA